MGADELIAAIRAAVRDKGTPIRKEVREILLPLSGQHLTSTMANQEKIETNY